MDRFEPRRNIGESLPIPDPDFKLASNHRFVLDFAKRHGGIYDLEEYGKYIRAKMPEGKNRDNAVLWNGHAKRKLSISFLRGTRNALSKSEQHGATEP